MQKPPGVGKPACASRARFAAFGPTRSELAAAASLSGRMKGAIRVSFGSTVAHSLSPRADRGWGEGASLLGSESRQRPLTLVRFAHSTSPRTRGEVSLFHMVAVARQRIDDGNLLDREV